MHTRVTERINDFHAIFILNRNQACNATFWRKIFKNKLAYTTVIKVRSNQENLIKKDLEKERRKRENEPYVDQYKNKINFRKVKEKRMLTKDKLLSKLHGTIVADHDK